MRYNVVPYSMRITLPASVLMSCSLDDTVMQREYGLTYVGQDGRKRTVFDGSLQAYVEVLDHCIAMDADHGAEDWANGATYTRNAARWAREKAMVLLAAGWAVRSPIGGIGVSRTASQGED